MTAQIARPILASAFAFVSACQTSGPVYRTYYVPETAEADATALVRAAETRCTDRANAEGQSAYEAAYRRAAVDVPRSTGSTTSGAPEGLAVSPAESQVLAATRMAATQAQQAQRTAWEGAMKTCMSEAGFREISVCVSACAQ